MVKFFIVMVLAILGVFDSVSTAPKKVEYVNVCSTSISNNGTSSNDEMEGITCIHTLHEPVVLVSTIFMARIILQKCSPSAILHYSSSTNDEFFLYLVSAVTLPTGNTAKLPTTTPLEPAPFSGLSGSIFSVETPYTGPPIDASFAR